MATSGFQVNGADLTATWPDKSYLIDRYPEFADTFKQAGLWVWGSNSSGILGDNTVTSRSSPIQTIAGGANWKFVAAGQAQTAGIKTDGTLWIWGANSNGELGTNNRTAASSPVQTVTAGTTWKQISLKYYHVGAIKTDGTLWMWGSNSDGILGDSTTASKSSPIQTVSGGTNWKQVACGFNHTAAIKTDGTLWLWGGNRYAQLGMGSHSYNSKMSSPVQTVSGGTSWKLVSCGFYTTAAIKNDGTLWTWGSNSFGQLGNNTNGGGTNSTAINSPVQTVAGGTNWKHVSIGASNVAAVKTDGTLWAWGRSLAGSTGDNTLVDRSSPVQTVAGGTTWKLVYAGNYFTTALKTDGTLWAWGYNTNGQLGDGTSADKSSPVQTVAGGNNWKLLAGGAYTIAAIRDDSSDPI